MALLQGKFSVLVKDKRAGLFTWLTRSEGYTDTEATNLLKTTRNVRTTLNTGWSLKTGTKFWHDYLNWMFGTYTRKGKQTNILASGAELLFGKGTYIIKKQIDVSRGPNEGSDGGKWPVSFTGVKSAKTTIKFEGTDFSSAGMVCSRTVSIKGITFKGDGNQKALVKVNVKRAGVDDKTDNEDDADSIIKSCVFEDFAYNSGTGRALELNLRNMKVFENRFTDTSGGAKVGVWHYFYNIWEDEDDDGETERGKNRKNNILNNTFELKNTDYAVRLGKRPNDKGEGKYSHYDGISVDLNKVIKGGLLYISGGKVGNAKQRVESLSLSQNTVTLSNTQDVSAVFAEKCGISCTIFGSDFDGKDKTSSAIFFDKNVDYSSVMVNSTFKNFKGRAIVIGTVTKNITGFSLRGSITSSTFNNADGVGCFNKNGELIKFNSSQNKMDEAPLPTAFYETPSSIEDKTPKTTGIDLEAVWKDLGSPKYTVFTGEKNIEKNDYTEVFERIEKGRLSGNLIVSKQMLIRKSITIPKTCTFRAPEAGSPGTILFLASAINADKGWGFILKANCNFFKINFSTTGVDAGQRDDDHDWRNEPGCNLIQVTKEGNRSYFKDGKCSGMKKKTGIRWDVAGKGKALLKNWRFNDSIDSVCLHIWASSVQNKGGHSKIEDITFHTGGRTVPVLVGNFLGIENCADIEDVSLYSKNDKLLCDIGGYLLGVNTDNKVKNIRVMGVNFIGSVAEDKNLNACIDLQKGKYTNVYVSRNMFNTTANGFLKAKRDFINVRKETTLSGNLAITENVFDIWGTEKDTSYSIGISQKIIDSKKTSGNLNQLSLDAICNGIDEETIGENTIRVLKNQNPDKKSQTLKSYLGTKNLNDFRYYSISGQSLI